MFGLEGMVGQMIGEDRWKPRGSNKEQIEELNDKLIDFFAECPFKEGDLVTPKKGTNQKGRGKPHKVLKVFPKSLKNAEPGHPMVDADFRIALVLGQQIKVFEDASTAYEPFEENYNYRSEYEDE